MRKLIGLILLLMMLVSTAAYAQEEPPPEPEPLYSLAYALSSGEEIHLVTYYTDNQWRGTVLQARILFGLVDTALALPQWSADGRTLYAVVYEPTIDNVATTIYAYDVASGSFDAVLAVVNPKTVDALGEFVNIESVSPDGHYAWTSRLLTFENQLIDLMEGSIILARTPCPAQVLAWLPDSVIVSCTGALFSEPNISVLDTASGASNGELLPPPADSQNPFASFIRQGQVLAGDERLLVGPFTGNDPAHIGLLELNAYAGTYFDIGTTLRLNAEQTFAAYQVDDRLKRLNLDTETLTDLGESAAAPAWNADAVGFWRTREHDGLFEIVHIESAQHRYAERILYSGAKPHNILYAPQAAVFALEFQPASGESYIEIYDETGLIWVSDFVYPGSFVALPSPIDFPIAWSGEWLHLNYISPETFQLQTLSVNVETLETIIAPEDRAIYQGESPDGQWWLYATSTNPDQDIKNRLFVYNPTTQEKYVVEASAPLYSNFQYPDRTYFLWSPAIPQPEAELEATETG